MPSQDTADHPQEAVEAVNQAVETAVTQHRSSSSRPHRGFPDVRGIAGSAPGRENRLRALVSMSHKGPSLTGNGDAPGRSLLDSAPTASSPSHRGHSPASRFVHRADPRLRAIPLSPKEVRERSSMPCSPGSARTFANLFQGILAPRRVVHRTMRVLHRCGGLVHSSPPRPVDCVRPRQAGSDIVRTCRRALVSMSHEGPSADRYW